MSRITDQIKVAADEGAAKMIVDSQAAEAGCAVCAKIIACFPTPVKEDYTRSMGKVASLLEGDCPHVDYFKRVQYMYGKVPEYEQKELFINHWPNETSVFFGCSHETKDINTWFTSAQMELVVNEDVPNHPGRALILDPQWIEPEVVRGWISSCHLNHGDRCKTLPLFRAEDDIRPTYLVDVLQKCLVKGLEVTTGYVALSYTWGETKALRNETKLCQQLQQPGILSTDEIAQALPPTIRDALAVVEYFGQRYLWVDALCIVQDDKDHLDFQLSQMHRIYACANFTIIAADGADAHFGLHGFKGITRPRSLRQEPVQLAASERIMQDIKSERMQDMQGYSFENRDSSRLTPHYYRRAWTFQESLFAKRQLIFTKNSIQWRCQCSNWDEDLLPDDRVDGGSVVFTWRWFHNPVPSLSTLSSIVQEYNQKEVTFPEDGFSAFAGVQTMLHRTFPCGLIYGHPEFFFDIALTWRPIGALKRRNARTTSQEEEGPPYLPSWSWTGWAGNLGFPSDNELEVVPTSIIDIDGYLAPVADWYTMKSPSSTERRRLNSDWHTYKVLAQKESDSLPSGWRREDYDINTGYHLNNHYQKHHFPREIPKYSYKHSTFNDESQLQWYPVPVLEPDAGYTLRPQTSYLYAKTNRAFLYGGRKMNDELHWCPGAPRIELVNSEGAFVGYLQLHNNDDLKDIEHEPSAVQRKPVELAATTRGYTGKIFDYELAKTGAKESGIEPWATQLKDCYFVLWIEWKDGVASRKGSGAVTVEAWEAEKEVEVVDLILG